MATEEAEAITFGEAIERYKGTVLLTKKPSTRHGYREILGSSPLARLVDVNLGDIDTKVFKELDAKLVKQKASSSRRRNFLVVVRSVLRASFAEGNLASMPVLPRLSKVGRSVVHAFPAEACRGYSPRPGRQFDSLLLWATFVTELLGRGAAVHAVKALAGHSSLAVTERYAHVGEGDLRAAITTLS